MDEFVWFALLQQADMHKGGETADWMDLGPWDREILDESKPEVCAPRSTMMNKWTVSLREKQSNYIKDIGKTNR